MVPNITITDYMTTIKKIATLFSLILCTLPAVANDVVTFEIDRNDGIDPSVPVQRMERNIARHGQIPKHRLQRSRDFGRSFIEPDADMGECEDAHL